RFERPDSKATGLGRGKGLEQAVADEVAVHAHARIGGGDRDAILIRADADGHWFPAARVQRVLKEMADRLLERIGVDQRGSRGVAEQADFTIAALGRNRGGQDRPQRLRLDPLYSAGGLWREAGEQVVHLADR